MKCRKQKLNITTTNTSKSTHYQGKVNDWQR